MENSAFGRLLGVLVAPLKTFASIAERPTWLAAFLVLALAPAIPTFLVVPKVDWEEVTRTQLESNPQTAELSREQMDEAVARGAKFAPFFAYAAPGFVAVGLLLLGLVCWGIFNLAGGQASFPRSMAVVSHGFMPVVVSSLLAIPVILGVDKIEIEDLKADTLIKSNLAVFAPEGASAAMLKLLSKIDVFSIWALVLLILGFSQVTKVKRGVAAAVVLLLWAIFWVGMPVGLAALFGGGKG
jgi:hypothetical protein